MDLQNDLFSGTRLVERVVPTSGTTVRLRLEALGDGTSVRVLEYHRRAPGERRFHRVATEEQRVVAFAGLGLAQPFDELFGRAAPTVHADAGAPAAPAAAAAVLAVAGDEVEAVTTTAASAKLAVPAAVPAAGSAEPGTTIGAAARPNMQ